MRTNHIKSGKKTLVRNLFGMRLNGYGADLYQYLNGEAAILFDRNTDRVKVNMSFKTLADAENYIEKIPGNNAGRLNTLLQRAGIFSGDNE